jgi:hypothetical protein
MRKTARIATVERALVVAIAAVIALALTSCGARSVPEPATSAAIASPTPLASPSATPTPVAAIAPDIGSDGVMTVPAEFAAASASDPELASSVAAFNGLPPEGQTTVETLASFVAANPIEAVPVLTELDRVLSGAVTIPGLTVYNDGSEPGSLGGFGIPSGVDIQELAFVVLMQATNDQDNDLQQIMDATEAQTKAKQFLRQQMQVVNADVAANAAQNATPTPTAAPTPDKHPILSHAPVGLILNKQLYTHFPFPTATSNGVIYNKVDLTGGGTLTSEIQLKAIQSQLQGDLDSMNEMSELTSMMLQMAMDRHSQFDRLASEIAKLTTDINVANYKSS